MPHRTSKDWLKATNSEIQDLYKVIRSIEREHGTKLNQIFNYAHKKHVALSPHDRGNFSDGDLSKARAAPLFKWVIENHLLLATKVAPKTFSPSMLTPWANFLEDHLKYGDLEVRLLNKRGLTSRSNQKPTAQQKVRLSIDEYYFALKTQMSGALLALEAYNGEWFPFSLNVDPSKALTSIHEGVHHLPTKADGETIAPLRDDESAGLHQFAFIVASKNVLSEHTDSLLLGRPIDYETLDGIAKSLSDLEPPKFEVHGLNVVFFN